MKKIILVALVASVAGATMAQEAKTQDVKSRKLISCAVMPSNKVDIAKATAKHMYADYKGKRYFFCCEGCPAEFKAAPAKYAKSASIPTPKKGKKA
jgi:YHS domain-containing protein